MARTKSPSIGKKSKAQDAISSPVIPDANPVTAEAPVESTQPGEANLKAHAAAAGANGQSVATTAPETRRFELHKTEPRRNVVPINVEDEIRRRAYEIFQQRGQGPGSEAEDWLVAEREVLQRYRQQRA